MAGPARSSPEANWLEALAATAAVPPAIPWPSMVMGSRSPVTCTPSDRKASTRSAMGRSRMRAAPSMT